MRRPFRCSDGLFLQPDIDLELAELGLEGDGDAGDVAAAADLVALADHHGGDGDGQAEAVLDEQAACVAHHDVADLADGILHALVMPMMAEMS